ncbi:MAG: hypothetical protein JWR86_2670, partial [Enterovirga sp.]|nr:hypothetical protein [Enterovirga sp.]
MSRFRDAVIDNWKTENSADFAYYDSAEGDLEAFWAKGGR